MYQQHDQLEGASRYEPQLISPHQERVSPPYHELPFQSYQHEAGQKLVDHGVKTSRSQRLLPVILSTVFVFVLYAMAFLNPGPGTILAIAICSTVVVAFLNGFLLARRH
jgi:hypothetical protein